MELRIKREQATSGFMGNKVAFVLRAQAFLTPDESAHIKKYGLGKEVIYASESARKHASKGVDALSGGGAGGVVSGLARIAASKLSLSITIDSLTNGQTIQCSSLDEAIDAEDALKSACANAKTYIEIASRYNGSEERFTI
jgi:hypothetical protein